MAVNIDLIIPGLVDLPVDELDSSFLNSELPALNQILRYARPYPNQAFDLEAMLIDAMRWSDLKTLPFAQAYAGHRPQAGDQNLLFRAVHLKADMHSALVLPLENNQTNYDDITLIINDLKDYFKVDCEIENVQESLWLMHLNQCTPAQHYPHYLSIIGRKADPYVEQSRQDLPWYKLINEMQMFMHQHDINRDRLASGLLPINSLWFWGAGDLSKITAKTSNWYCDDELLSRFASVSGINSARLDEIKSGDFTIDSVIVDMTLLEALKFSSDTSLRVLLGNMEAGLFEPLLRKVKANKCILRLRFGSSMDLILGRYSSYKWWTRSISLIDFTRQ